MFPRIVKAKGKEYLVIVESYWQKGKIKQRNIASLGNLKELHRRGEIEKLAKALVKYCEERKNLFDIQTIKETNRKKWGVVKVTRKLWEMFEIEGIISKVNKGRKKKIENFLNAINLMLLDRLQEPKSKLRSYEEQGKYWGIEKNDLHHLYRALDILADEKEKIEKELFDRNRTLFNTKVDVVLYDVTTFYFESVKSNGLKEFGFSKDCKVNEVQVLLGLMIDMEGRAVGYEIFPGNTFEGHTLVEMIEKIKKRFEIGKVIFVGDQAMLSKENLEIIKDAKYEYVVGSRIKNKREKMKREFLDLQSYKSLNFSAEEEKEIKYKEIQTEEGKIILTWSKKRAEADYEKRQRLIENAKKRIKGGLNQIVNKRGAVKYIKIEINEDKKFELDEDKIKEDEKWDGFYGIETNCVFKDATQIVNYYHSLWMIEEAFRIFKTHLEARPMFHWTEKRIKGHFMLCFIAFLFERTIEIELRKNKIEFSPQKIRDALDELEFSEILLEGNQKFFIRSKVEGLANDILRTFKIKIPPHISTPEKF